MKEILVKIDLVIISTSKFCMLPIRLESLEIAIKYAMKTAITRNVKVNLIMYSEHFLLIDFSILIDPNFFPASMSDSFNSFGKVSA